MIQWPPALVEWLAALPVPAGVVAFAAVLSVALAVAGSLFVPWLLVRIPADYLQQAPRPPGTLSVGRLLLWILRHLLAATLLLAGIAMLVLPGQGLLTIVVALSMMDLPRKRDALRWLLHKTGLERPINRLRARRGKAPLLLDP